MSNIKYEAELSRSGMTKAIEKFMIVPDRLADELRPVVDKLSRLGQSPMAIWIKTGAFHKMTTDEIRGEVNAFLGYTREIPRKYLAAMDSELDLLGDEEMDKEDLGRRYVHVITHLKHHLNDQITKKYESAIRVILEYREKWENPDLPGGEPNEWVAPRDRHTEPVFLSELPPPILEQLRIEKEKGTLTELTLDEIQDVAHNLALCVSHVEESE